MKTNGWNHMTSEHHPGMKRNIWANYYIIPRPELREFEMVSLSKPPVGVTTRQEKVAMICPGTSSSNQTLHPGSLTVRLWKMVVGRRSFPIGR